MDLARSFCSYIKHGERGKLKRRAKASANIVLRMFLYIIEDFHLRLSERMAGSTIAIGGEEKKQKITLSTQSAILENQEMTKRVQATQDATKWNECLSPDIFGMLHKVYFNDEVRLSMNLNPINEQERCMYNVCMAGHFLLACKMITLGEGPLLESDKTFNNQTGHLTYSPG